MIDRARLKLLRSKSSPTDDDYAEMDELGDAIRQEQLLAVPRPTCCESAKRYATVYLRIDEGGLTAHWNSMTIESNYDSVPHDLAWLEQRPAARFCTFCGTPLPEMVRKAKPPEPLCDSGDGYYCGTCNERLQCCTCFPETAAFEPKVP